MLKKKLHTLQSKQDRIARAQGDIQNEILANSVHPQQTMFLLHQMCNNAVEYYQTQQEWNHAIELKRKGWWARLMGR